MVLSRAVRAASMLLAASLLAVPVLLAASLLAVPAWGQSDSREHALALYRNGDVAGALAEVEGILEKSPDEQNALFNSAQFNFELRNLDAARGRMERLVRLSGSNATAWELMAQIAQAQGDLKRRDEAIERSKIAIRSAIDPELRRKTILIRDRIPIGREMLVAADYFDRHGNDFVRYQFTIRDPVRDPDTGILLRTDTATTETWAETALLPPDQRLFHLDMVDWTSGGTENVAIYQFYVGEPGYDVVRAKVLEILRGQAVPLSGKPGSLAGVLKP